MKHEKLVDLRTCKKTYGWSVFFGNAKYDHLQGRDKIQGKVGAGKFPNVIDFGV
jgi:hypothetical protein